MEIKMLSKSLASPYQRRFWLEWKLDKFSSAYHTPIVFELNDSINIETLKRSLKHFVNQVDLGCRSTFYEDEDEKLWQIVLKHVDVNFNEILVGSENSLPSCIKELISKPFDLEKGPLFRFSFVSQESGKKVIVLNFHHIISDAKSASLFLQWLQKLYDDYDSNNDNLFEEAYFSLAHQKLLVSESSTEDVDFWASKLSNHKLLVDLPELLPKCNAKKNITYSQADISSETFKNFKSFIRKNKTTTFILLSSALACLFRYYSGNPIIPLNYPIDVRKPEQKNTIGCFVNNFPLVLNCTGKFSEVLLQAKAMRKFAKKHPNCTLIDIITSLRKNFGFIDKEFFNVMIFEAYFDFAAVETVDGVLQSVPFVLNEMVGDMSFAYQQEESSIKIRVNFDENRLSHDFIDAFVNDFMGLLNVIISRQDSIVDEYFFDIPSSKNRQQYMQLDTAKDHLLLFDNVLEAFLHWVKHSPNNIAYEDEKEKITFLELSKKVAYARDHLENIMPDDNNTVAIFHPKSSDLVIFILATLALGYRYLPMHTHLVKTQVSRILKLAQPGVIVTVSEYQSKVDNSYQKNIPLILSDLLNQSTKYGGANADNIKLNIDKHNDAYLIFTSGSTGEPKGVAIQHSSLVNVINHFAYLLNFTQEDSFCSLSSPGFDIFALELFLPLYCAGKHISVDDESKLDQQKLLNYLVQCNPSIVQATPSLWNIIKLSGWQGEPARLQLLCGGESLSGELAEYLIKISRQAYQVYGPTETTIWSTVKYLKTQKDAKIIGVPISSTAVSIVQEKDEKEVVCCYCRGELSIYGAGVANGYLNSDSNAFVTTESGLSLYRTGDQVYWNNRSEIVYIGRYDNQIKISGYRIELGEIEYQLTLLENVTQVIVKYTDVFVEKSLVAFIKTGINSLDEQQTGQKIKSELRLSLPSYMIPQYIIFVSEFPLTSSGKIDRNSPIFYKYIKDEIKQNTLSENASEFTSTEKLLSEIWEEVLHINISDKHDDFFHLGGHSIKAVNIIHKIQEQFSIYFTYSEFSSLATIKNIATQIDEKITDKKQKFSVGQHQFPLEEMYKNNFKLSVQQKHLYLSTLNNSHKNSANIIIAQRIKGNLNLARLNDALTSIVKFHPQLLIRIKLLDGSLIQSIIEKELNLSVVPFEDQSDLLETLSKKANEDFALNTEPAYKFCLYQIENSEYIFLAIFHHIAIDGWSVNLLNKQISYIYNNKLNQKEALKWLQSTSGFSTYYNYIIWQNDWKNTQDYKNSVKYWQKYLSGFNPIVTLNHDNKAKHIKADMLGLCETQSISLPPAVSYQLNALLKNKKLPALSVLLGTFCYLLSAYSREKNISVFTPIANRTQQQFANTVGFFTQLVPVSVDFDRINNFDDLFNKINKDIQLHQQFLDVPHDEIYKFINEMVKESLKVVFSLQNANDNYTLELDNLELSTVEIFNTSSIYDLHMDIHYEEQAYVISIKYNTVTFSKDFIINFISYYINCLEKIINGHSDLNQINYTNFNSSCYLNRALSNDGSKSFSSYNTLVQKFCDICDKYSDNIAIIVDGQNSLTYQQLHEASNQLANYLLIIKKDIKITKGDLNFVGICLYPSAMTLVAIIAVLKINAAYVPIAADNPSERVDFICEDADLPIVLCDSKTISKFSKASALAIDISTCLDWQKESISFSLENISSTGKADLAYVIYTSGTTGRPKGTLLSHANVLSLFDSAQQCFEFSSQDTWCLFHSIAFDFSVWEIWGALFYGGKLLIPSNEELRDTLYFRKLLKKYQVSILNQTPTAFYQFIRADQMVSDQLLNLKYVIFGGEALHFHAIKDWIKKYSLDKTKLVNMYGITETTVHVTFYSITYDDIIANQQSIIGKPLPHLRIYILDHFFNICPDGNVGQMYIAGDGLAKGYLNLPKLQAQKFVALDNKAVINEERLYATGDLARSNQLDLLEYMGRQDNQVKFHGYRIEFSEIEYQCETYPRINQAKCIIHHGHDCIVIFFTAFEDIASNILKQYLESKLPTYMVPRYCVQLSEFKRNLNGKIDENALNQIKIIQSKNDHMHGEKKEYDLDYSEEQRTLIEACQSILKEDVSLESDFFHAGGDSIIVLELVEYIRKKGFKLEPITVFKEKIIEKIAIHMSPVDVKSKPIYKPFELVSTEEEFFSGDCEDIFPATMLQKGMFFHSQFEEASLAYIDVVSCKIVGELNKNLLNTMLQKQVTLHSTLRTTFFEYKNEIYQKINKNAKNYIVYLDIPQKGSESDRVNFVESDLQHKRKQLSETAKDIPWKICVYLFDDNKYVLSLICHHAILDGWSVTQLLSDLLKDYDNNLTHNQDCSDDIRCLEYSYGLYVKRQLSILNDKNYYNFWVDYLKDKKKSCIKKDYKNHNLNMKTLKYKLPLSQSEVDKLQLLTKQAGVSFDTTFLSLHLISLAIYLGRSEIVSAFATNGRFDEIDDSKKMLGLFVNICPIIINNFDEDTPIEILEKIEKQKLNVLPFKDYPLEVIFTKISQKILFDTLFNFINFHNLSSLKNLKHIQVSQDFCIEETNLTLINQVDVSPNNESISLEWIYKENGIDISKFTKLYALVLNQFISNKKISQLDLTHFADYKTRFFESPFLPSVCPENINLYDIFCKQVEKNSNKVAIFSNDEKPTFSELKERADQLSGFLVSNFSQKKAVVGLLFRRNSQHIIAMLSCLELGYCYIPLDPSWPKKRIIDVIVKSKADLLITSQDLLFDLNNSELNHCSYLVCNDYDYSFTKGDCSYHLNQHIPEGSACILYTSGSTGVPKGVIIKSQAIFQLIFHNGVVSFTKDDNVISTANFVFDASLFEIWGALLSGATLYIPEKNSLIDSQLFGQYVCENKIKIMWLTARLFDQYVYANISQQFFNLKYLIIGGEKLNIKSIRHFLLECSNSELCLLNGYGPTECTTFTTFQKINEADLDKDSLPIGRAISNTRTYILDEDKNILPIGEEGTLYVAGDCVAAGYVNNSELTKASFLKDQTLFLPLTRDFIKERLYNTGDRALYNRFGQIEYLGRDDSLVKLNGFRVDLSEITNFILSNTEVIDVFVQLDDNSIVVYFVSEKSDLTEENIIELCQQNLPQYMCPKLCYKLDYIPLNSNGKIDKSKLPRRNLQENQCRVTPNQQKILSLWQSVLGVDYQISIDQSFFDVGGNSLMAMQLHQMIEQNLKIKIAITALFQYPTIKTFSQYIFNGDNNEYLKEDKAFLINQAQTTNNRNKIASIRKKLHNQLESTKNEI